MPGVYVVDPLRRAPPGVQQPSIVQPQGAVPQAPPTQQRTITLPPPKAEVLAAALPKAQQPRIAAVTPAPAVIEAPAAPPQVKKPAPRPAAVAPAGVGAAGSGFVAVLSSQRSQMDALKSFADLQQKYPTLQGKTPNVIETNLGDKGIYHRLVVGPGPRDQASALCTELKAAGYVGCWVTAQ